MSGKGKRRSARLLKLEEQKNDDDVDACRLDPWQIIRNIVSRAAHGKRKKNGEIQKLQGEASSSQAIDTAYTGNISGKGPTSGQIIEHILNTLEMRDRLDLFTMPDDIQVCDYAEWINRPSDFATLRQKNTDGMYQTLEQFENDVYIVFQKAISINSQDTIPYREAMSLMDQAKQVFLSLKSNRIYTESELLAWSQKQLDVGPSKPGRDQEARSIAVAPAPAQQQPSSTPVKRKDAGTVTKQRQQISLMKKAGNVSAGKGKARLEKGAREGKSTPAPVKRARKAVAMATAAAVEPGDARLGKRRLTYKYNGDRSSGRAIMMPLPLMLPALGDRHARLVQHPQVQGHTYHDSLRRFMRHAGLRARLAAEFRSLECEDRARQNPSQASYWNGFAMGGGTYYPASPLSVAVLTPPSGGTAIDEQVPECKLETDSLVKLAMRMRTPEFLESTKQVFGDTRGKASLKEGHVISDDLAVTEAAVPAPAQTSGISKTAFGPFAPPKLAPGRLGFGQFAGSSARPFKVKPPSLNSPGKKKRE